MLGVFLGADLGAEILGEPLIDVVSEDKTRLEASLAFPDASRLELRIGVKATANRLFLELYSFHYMNRDGTRIFRYDNSQHHFGLPYFPHHKHEGPDERVFGCRQPSVRTIRDEIEKYLMDNS